MWCSLFNSFGRKKKKQTEDEDVLPKKSLHGIRNQPKRQSSFPEPRVLIIGAGVAGLACATKLIHYGFKNVFIIEASDRIGGRVQTIPFGENVIDLGAQWCHGEKNNAVYRLCKNHNVFDSTGSTYTSYECRRSNGEIVPNEVVERLKNMIIDIAVQNLGSLGTFNGSLGEFLDTNFNKRLEKVYDVDKSIAIEFFENFKKIESSETSAPLDVVSVRSIKEYWQCEGDYFLNWKNKGFREFLRILTQAHDPDDEFGVLKGRIFLSMRVSLIDWDQEDDTVKVYCEGYDEPFDADHVIVTVSLGVLKHFHKKMFRPELPTEKRVAIQSLGFGDVLKIFIEFPNKFWPDDWRGFATLWRSSDIEKLRGTKDEWLEHVSGFFVVDYQPKTLLTWVVGEHVKYIEQLSEDELIEKCMFVLSKFMEVADIPTPVKIVRSTWATDKNFCGCYSFYSVAAENNRTSAAVLGQPLSILAEATASANDVNEVLVTQKPVILFAGEATHPHYFSTVHGAVESGWREAKRLSGYHRRGSIKATASSTNAVTKEIINT